MIITNNFVWQFTQTFCNINKVRSIPYFIRNQIRLKSMVKKEYILSKMEVQVRCRDNPVIFKMESPEFKSIFTPELLSLVELFKRNNYELRIAGGAVRDLLMGKTPKDIDFATTATPDKMKEIFTTENIRMINMNGERHGTITPRINDKENFEITTLRIDVATDGRHAKVEFTTDWKLDANRRDLTINSMFLGFDGSVYDYYYGYDDLKEKKVRFVGNAETRIKEDYLRILRYFRFYGRIAENPNEHDAGTLKCIRNNASGLQNVSGERIWVEIKKMIEGPMGGDLIKTMIEAGVSKYIGLPEDANVTDLNHIWLSDKERSPEHRLKPISLLCALFRNQQEAMNLHLRLKLSAYERDLALFLVQNREEMPSEKPLLPYQKLILGSSKSKLEAKSMVIELLKYQDKINLAKQLEEWDIPKFPVSGDALKQNGVRPGKVLGPVLKRLKSIWADNDFNITSEELLKHLPEILDEIKNKNNNI